MRSPNKSFYSSIGGSNGSEFSFFNIFITIATTLSLGLGIAGLTVALWDRNTPVSTGCDSCAQLSLNNTTTDGEGLVVYDPVSQEYSSLVGDTTGQRLEWSNLHNAWMLSPVTRERIGHIFYESYYMSDVTSIYQDIISSVVHIGEESPYWNIAYNTTTGEIELSGVRFDNSSVDYIPPTQTAFSLILDEVEVIELGPVYKFFISIRCEVEGTDFPFILDFELEQCTEFESGSESEFPSAGGKEFTQPGVQFYERSYYVGYPERYISADFPLCVKLQARDVLDTLVPTLDIELRKLKIEFEFVTV